MHCQKFSIPEPKVQHKPGLPAQHVLIIIITTIIIYIYIIIIILLIIIIITIINIIDSDSK